MSRSAVRYLWAASLFIASSGAYASSEQAGRANSPEGAAVSSQESEREYVDRVRKDPPLTVAMRFLLSRQRTFMLDMIRRRPNTKMIIGQDTVTAANVEEYSRRFDRERQIMIDVIGQRGFLNIAGVYDLQKDSKNECRLEPAALVGPFTIRQDAFNIELDFLKASLKGIILESSMAAEPSERGLGDIFFVGQVSNGQIEIGFAGGGSDCKIGILVKQDK
jgi:hypothetical protein